MAFGNRLINTNVGGGLVDPKGFYEFENNALDSSGNNYTLTVPSSVSFPTVSPTFSTDSKFGFYSSLHSTQSLTVVQQWASYNSDAEMSATFWFKPDNSQFAWILGDRSEPSTGIEYGTTIYITAANEVGVAIGFVSNDSNHIIPGANYNPNAWNFVSYTRNSSGIIQQIFVNGTFYSSPTGGVEAFYSAPNLIGGRIYRDSGGTIRGAFGFDGKVDQVRIFDIQLTNDQIISYYNE